jgi:hypothetical protein
MTQDKTKAERSIGDNSFADNDNIYEAAYKKMRVVCQIMHNRLEFLRDNLDEARNGKKLADRVEGLAKARGEIKFIQTHTGPLQGSYHNYPEDDYAAANFDEIEEKHGREIADAEKLIVDLDNAKKAAATIAQDSYIRGDL